MAWRALDRFFRRYFAKKGFLDGTYGFVIAYFDALYQFLSYLKYTEFMKQKKIARAR